VQVTLTATPARHAGNLPLRLALPPVMGSVLECRPVGAPPTLGLYISGDTMPFEGLRDVARRWPHLDAAVLHLDGTRLAGGFVVTLDGARGADLAALLRPEPRAARALRRYTVMASPLADFLTATHDRGLADRVAAWKPGQHAVITPRAVAVT
jgi:hypothetical protein